MKAKRFLKILILLSILFSAFGCSKEKTAPDDLIGVWITSEEKYDDRFFELGRDSITFGIGEEQANTYPIITIEKETVRGIEGTLYTIFYKNEEGQESKFSFYYQPTDQGVIRFKNQYEIIWTKEKK